MDKSTKIDTGYVEKPKYIDSELIKAVDVVVDELIGSPYKQKIETIALKKYEDLQKLLDTAKNEAVTLTNKLSISNSEIVRLNGIITVLEQELDAEKILTAVANNETQSANERYASLLSQFQSTVTKGVQEAIARVSLEAQVAGLQAQKQVLKDQYDVLIGIVASLQDQLTGAAAASTAAAQGFVPGQNAEFYYKLEKTNGKDWSDDRYVWETARINPTSNQFAKLKVQNLNDIEGNLITKVKLYLTGDLKDHGPFGFTDAKIPVDVKVIDIAQGETKSILLFGGNNIGGGNSGTPRPSKGGWFGDSATDYKGTIQVEVTYSDGTTEKGDELNWTIRKNKG